MTLMIILEPVPREIINSHFTTGFKRIWISSLDITKSNSYHL